MKEDTTEPKRKTTHRDAKAVGDLLSPLLKDLQKKQKTKKSAVARRLLEAEDEILSAPAHGKEIAFLARLLVQASFPHSDPGEAQVWQRRNGNLTMNVTAKVEVDKKTGQEKNLGLPYGTIPRLLLFWISTEVLRTKSRRIELGESLRSFMKKLGLDPERGGPRSDATRLKEQMLRLFHSTISFVTEDEDKKTWSDMQVAPKGMLWWEQKKGKKGWIRLGEDFYQAIVEGSVPVDLRAIRALKNSSLALDFYAWTTYRSFTVQMKGKDQFIPWRAVVEQVGSDYTDLKDFKKKAKAALEKIKQVYPGLKIKYRSGGFVILKETEVAVAIKTREEEEWQQLNLALKGGKKERQQVRVEEDIGAKKTKKSHDHERGCHLEEEKKEEWHQIDIEEAIEVAKRKARTS